MNVSKTMRTIIWAVFDIPNNKLRNLVNLEVWFLLGKYQIINYTHPIIILLHIEYNWI